MTAGFWLRINDKWLPLDGVQSGVPIKPERSTSPFVALGGRRYVSRSKRAAREWSLDLTHATPEAVRLLALAANGHGGDVMLLDVSRARANMLDPLETVGPSDYPLLDCAGLPLRSLSIAGPLTKVVDVVASANVMLESNGRKSVPSIGKVNPNSQLLFRFGVPLVADGTLSSAGILLTRTAANPTGQGLNVLVSGNNWIEDGIDGPDTTWIGASMGTGVDTNFEYSIALAGVSAYLGTALSVRVRKQSGTIDQLIHMRSTSAPTKMPRLRLTFALPTPENPTFSAVVRGDHVYRLTGFTDVAAGAPILTYNVGAGAATVNAPAGVGSRPFTATFTPAADAALAGVVTASTTGKVAGLRLVEGDATSAWVPGQKSPCRVSISDPDQTLNFLDDGEQGRSDYRVTIQEVG